MGDYEAMKQGELMGKLAQVKERRAGLVRALRSNVHRQGFYRMATLGMAGNLCHCILGVICEESGLGRWESVAPNAIGYRVRQAPARVALMPVDVMAHYWFRSPTGVFSLRRGKLPHWFEMEAVKAQFTDPAIRNGAAISLAALNDAGMAFPKLADVIEAAPEGLFWPQDEHQAMERAFQLEADNAAAEAAGLVDWQTS